MQREVFGTRPNAKSFSGRIYFLGAGASKAFYANLPLATELTLGRLLQPESYLEPPHGAIDALRKFLNQAHVSDEQINSPLENDERCFHYPYENLFRCILRRLDFGTNTHRELFNWLRDVSERGDLIVTTNYDSVLEWNFAHSDSILTLRTEYGVSSNVMQGVPRLGDFPGVPEKTIRLLKLHGSVSWTYCPACKAHILDELHKYGAEDALTNSRKCVNCKEIKSREPVFVLPFSRKDYSEPAIKEIWTNAERNLEAANEIIFVGFSLSPTDQHIRALLSRAHQLAKTPKILLIDTKAQNLLPRYEEIYGNSVSASTEVGWREYLNAKYALVR